MYQETIVNQDGSKTVNERPILLDSDIARLIGEAKSLPKDKSIRVEHTFINLNEGLVAMKMEKHNLRLFKVTEPGFSDGVYYMSHFKPKATRKRRVSKRTTVEVEV